MNISLTRGDSLDLALQALLNGAAIDLSPSATTLTFEVVDGSGTVFLTKTIGAGITVTTPLTGMFTVSLVPNDTKDVAIAGPAKNYNYEVRVVTGAGKAYTLFSGIFSLLKDIINAQSGDT